MGRFDVPIALFNFNRPELTRRVFEVVRQIKPRRLLLVADGPRASRPEDVQLCADVRAVFETIDWECEVTRNFSDVNMGSFRRNSSGLDWVFDSVEEAIVLEDDCLPSLTFFRYCEELLDRYRNDQRIGAISGNNFVPPGVAQGDASYFFSSYALTWGWATWSRVWKQVDLTMSWWEPEACKEMLRTIHPQTMEWQYWHSLYESIHNGQRKNAWDYQLILSSFRNSQLCVVPKVNLVSNIGFGAGATHLTDDNTPLANIPNMEMDFPLKHPASLWRSEKMDAAIFQVRILDQYKPPSLGRRAVSKIASLLPAAWKSQIKNWLQAISNKNKRQGSN